MTEEFTPVPDEIPTSSDVYGSIVARVAEERNRYKETMKSVNFVTWTDIDFDPTLTHLSIDQFAQMLFNTCLTFKPFEIQQRRGWFSYLCTCCVSENMFRVRLLDYDSYINNFTLKLDSQIKESITKQQQYLYFEYAGRIASFEFYRDRYYAIKLLDGKGYVVEVGKRSYQSTWYQFRVKLY